MTKTDRKKTLAAWEACVQKRAAMVNMLVKPYWWEDTYANLLARKARYEAILWPE